MNSKSAIQEIIDKINHLQDELEEEAERLLEEKREQFHYNMRRGRVVFEKSIKHWQRQQKKKLFGYIANAPLSYIITAPVIYGMVIPLALLDLSITLYQYICFKVYGIPLVSRKNHIIIDRHHLAYLNAIEKFNCIYCGYGNGVIAYAREVTARTEQFWCPIKHARRISGSHQYCEHFFDYGDMESWCEDFETVRRDWSKTSYSIDNTPRKPEI